MPEDHWILEDSTESLLTKTGNDFNWRSCSKCGLFIMIHQQSPFNLIFKTGTVLFHLSKINHFTIPQDILLVYYIDDLMLIGPGEQ